MSDAWCSPGAASPNSFASAEVMLFAASNSESELSWLKFR